MGARFVPNPRLAAMIARSVALEHELKKYADQALEVARSIAPVDSGAYRDGLASESGVEGPTVKARLNAHDFKSLWIEVGTSNWPAHATLRRAADAVGLRITGIGRG